MWALAALVPGAVSLAIIPLVIYSLRPPDAAHTDAPATARAMLAGLGPITRNERVMAVTSIFLLAAWILGSAVGLDVTAAALVAVAALLLTGALAWEDACCEQEAWNTFIWFATLLMMASYLGEFGLITWFTTRAGPLFSGIGWVPGLVGLGLVYFYSHYFFASITAHVSAMYAPFLAVALALGAPPLLAALLLAFFSSLFASLTHYGTAPAPILFGSGHVPLGTWWRVGLAVSVVNIAIWLGIGSAWWKLLGLW
jgi:DASS family divalent anion:Na+ symporter